MRCSVRLALNLTWEFLLEMNQHDAESLENLNRFMDPKQATDHDIIYVDAPLDTGLSIAKAKPQ